MDDSYLDVSRNEAIMEGNRFLIEGLRERVSTGLRVRVHRERVSTGLKERVSSGLRERVSSGLRVRVSMGLRESTGAQEDGWGGEVQGSG